MAAQPTRRARAGWLAAQPAATVLAKTPVFLQLDAGRPINAGGRRALIKLGHKDCGGVLELQSQVFLPGEAIRAHRHDGAAQFSIVVTGELGFLVGAEERVMGPGGYVYKPPGTDHMTWNAGDVPAWQFEGQLPGALMGEYFAQFTALMALAQIAEPRAVEKLAAEFETFFNDDLTAAVEAAHRVSASGGPKR